MAEMSGFASKIQILKSTMLFHDIDDEVVAQLAAKSVLRSFTDGLLLFRQGERAEGFYVVADGEIEVFRQNHQREQILHNFAEGEVCGEVPIFAGGSFPASARAKGDLDALYIPGDIFLDIATEHPEMLLEMLAVMSVRLRKFANLIATLSLKDVAGRLAEYLLAENRKVGNAGSLGKRVPFDIGCSKKDLATRLGTIPETLSRALGRFASSGLIAVDGRSIEILDEEGLMKVTEV